jgi:Holliday junction resolvase-like predicted endonuclease
VRENKPTKSIGSEAEHLVANHLIEHGHFILDMNWKTKWCEIDIISKKDNTVFLTEVKYRKISNWGSGLEAITTKKLSQMKLNYMNQV